MPEKHYWSKSVKQKADLIEERIKTIISLIKKNKISEAKKTLLAEMESKDIPFYTCKRKMNAILGLIYLNENDIEDAERCFLEAIKSRRGYDRKRVEKETFLISYMGLAMCCSRKIDFEKNKANKNILKIKIETYAELAAGNIESEENAEKNELLKEIIANVMSLKESRGSEKLKKIRNLGNMSVIQLIDIFGG